MASNLLATAPNLLAMATNLLAMAYILIDMFGRVVLWRGTLSDKWKHEDYDGERAPEEQGLGF